MHFLRLAALPAVLLVTLGCQSVVTGNEGNFRFSYAADDDVLDFNKPVAVGAYLDLRVTEVGTDAPVELTDATTDDDAVMAVTTFASNTLTVQGTGDGEVLITVKGAAAGGEELTDSVNMLSRVPDVHTLTHTCGADGETAYLAGQDIYVPFEFARANGQPVIGYGYYPVTADAGLTLDPEWQGSQYMKLATGAAGSHTLTSDLDGSVLDVTLVTPADLDGVAQPIAFVLEDVDVGDTNPFYVLPTAGARTVCQADTTYAVESLTPDTCAVAAIPPFAASGSDAGKEFGWFEVTGVAAGECRYTVTYALGAAGAGVTAEFSYPIEP